MMKLVNEKPQVGDRIRIVREGVVTAVGTGSDGKGVMYRQDGAVSSVNTSRLDVVEVIERAKYVPEVGDKFRYVGYQHAYTLLSKGVTTAGTEYWVVEDRFQYSHLQYPQPGSPVEKV